MTTAGYRALHEELKRLKGQERPRISRAIEEAREHGDLSENAEYHAAKEEQGLLEARIRDIEGKLATAQVIDTSTLGGDKVVFGATVEIIDLDTDEHRIVTVVGEDEADASRGLISWSSPLARALIGKELGDVANVNLPSGTKEYEIEAVRFDSAEG